MSAFKAFSLYRSLKLHFNSDNYDYFKYHGKVRFGSIPENQFYIFEKVYKKYHSDLETFFVSNYIENSKLWVNDLLSDECESIYKDFLYKKESMGYIFRNDIVSLIEEYENLNDTIVVKNDFPILMRKTLQGKLQLNSLLILNSMIKFFPMWDKKIDDELIWVPFKVKCMKYFPFITFDRNKMLGILKKEIRQRKV